MASFNGDLDNNVLIGTTAFDGMFGFEGDDTVAGKAGNDLVNGNEGNDFVYGGYDDDVVRGGQGNDVVSGDNGNDIIYGDLGSDTLIGGDGADIFVLQPIGDPTTGGAALSDLDLITDFVDNQDLIGLNGLTFIDLEVTAGANNSVIVRDRDLGQYLAQISGVNVEQITEEDFQTSPQRSTLVNGVGSGDTTQTSTVFWTRSTVPGIVTFEYSTDPEFSTTLGIAEIAVTDIYVPAKANITNLTPGTQYYYRVTGANGEQEVGQFRTPNALGTREGLTFGVSGDLQGALAPFVSLKNADEQDLDFFVQMGDMMEADTATPILPGVTQAKTLEEFRLKHSEIYSPRYGLNTWADLRASTSIYGTWDDHEITNDFAGGATPEKSPQKQDIFGKSPTGYVNETPVFKEALQAFQEYFPVRDEFYGETGDDRTAGKQKLYRYNTFGSDAATFVLDLRSFRDAPLPFVAENAEADKINQVLTDAFNPDRTLLGQAQLDEFKADLLEAQENGITWKFVMSTVPMQNFGIPTIGERWEGYAAERAELLNFIEENNIENVVFVTGDFHGNVVNNVTNQQGPNQPVTPTGAFDVMIGPVGIQLTVPFLPAPFNQTFAAPFGPATIGFTPASLLEEQGKSQAEYLALTDQAEKDQYVREVLDYRTETLLGYDPIGLEDSPIDATLLQGEYLAVHTYGWTEFDIAPETGELTVTTYGVPPYTEAQLLANPTPILSSEPVIVSQFQVNPVI